jgi:tartrate dehydrogenase/decarboxylase/D-malate dehydrogenase
LVNVIKRGDSYGNGTRKADLAPDHLAHRALHTGDLGGTAKTAEVTRAVCEFLASAQPPVA